MTPILLGGLAGIGAGFALLALVYAHPAWFDDHALTSRPNPPDELLLQAQREVDALTPGSPRIAPQPMARQAGLPVGRRANGQPWTINGCLPPPNAPVPRRRPVPPGGRTRLA